MNIHAHKEIVLHLERGDEHAHLYWKHLYEDDNTYGAQFILKFPDITIDCIYCFTDGKSYTMIVNTETVTHGEVYNKIIPLFAQIARDRKYFD